MTDRAIKVAMTISTMAVLSPTSQPLKQPDADRDRRSISGSAKRPRAESVPSPPAVNAGTERGLPLMTARASRMRLCNGKGVVVCFIGPTGAICIPMD
jgi:hypothetical protein